MRRLILWSMIAFGGIAMTGIAGAKEDPGPSPSIPCFPEDVAPLNVFGGGSVQAVLGEPVTLPFELFCYIGQLCGCTYTSTPPTFDPEALQLLDKTQGYFTFLPLKSGHATVHYQLCDSQARCGLAGEWTIEIVAPEDAALVSHTIPPQIARGNIVPVEIKMRNTGAHTWSVDGGYGLMVLNDGCGVTSESLIALAPGTVVEPDAEHIFSTVLTGSASLTTCTLEMRMFEPSAGPFGQIVVAGLTFVDPKNDASAISSSLPSSIAPETSIGVGFTFRNTGNTVWSEYAPFFLTAISDPCGVFESFVIPLRRGDSVAPNETYQFIAQIGAPLTTGDCAVQLRMQMEDMTAGPASPIAKLFGETMNVVIHVAEPPNLATNWEGYE